MTSAPTIYPDYCHSLSPTIGKWCPLAATDVHRLKTVGMFCDERPLYHYTNHPVKWLRITGVVVAIDDFGPRRVYTVDDSSGVCVECVAIAPVSALVVEGKAMPRHLDQIASLAAQHSKDAKKPVKEEKGRVDTKEGEKLAPSVQKPAVPWDDIDVGVVVKVKGRVTSFRDAIQIEVIKVEVLRCTDQEVRCWNEVRAFKRDVIGNLWVVTPEEEEKGRKVRERELRRARKGVGDKGRRRVEVQRNDGTVVEDLVAGRRNNDKERTGEERRVDRREVERKEQGIKRMKEREEEVLMAKVQKKKSAFPSLAVMKAAKGKYDALGI